MNRLRQVNPLADTVYTFPVSGPTSLSFEIENNTAYHCHVARGSFVDINGVKAQSLATVPPFTTKSFDLAVSSTPDITVSCVLDSALIHGTVPANIDTVLALVTYGSNEVSSSYSNSSWSPVNPSTVDIAPNYPYTVNVGTGAVSSPPIDSLGWNGVLIRCIVNTNAPGTFAGLFTVQQCDTDTFATNVLAVLQHAHHAPLFSIPRILRYCRVVYNGTPDNSTQPLQITARRTQEDLELKIVGHNLSAYQRKYNLTAGVPLTGYMPVNPPTTELVIYNSSAGTLTWAMGQMKVLPEAIFNDPSGTNASNVFQTLSISVHRAGIGVLSLSNPSAASVYLSTIQRNSPPL